jgi:hypothetical protein
MHMDRRTVLLGVGALLLRGREALSTLAANDAGLPAGSRGDADAAVIRQYLATHYGRAS